MALDWVIDYVPGWVGPTAILVGLLLCSASLLRQSKRRLVSDVVSAGEYAVLSLLGIVFVWAVTNLLQAPAFFVRYPTVYTAVFVFASKWIEGASAILLYQKLSYAVEHTSWPGSTSLRTKAAQILTLLLLGIVGTYAGIGALLFSPLSVPFDGVFVVVWTLATFVASLLGLTWKVSKVDADISRALLYGTLLILAGSEITNLATVAAEIRVFVAGGVGYTLGYLATLVLWLFDIGAEAEPTAARF